VKGYGKKGHGKEEKHVNPKQTRRKEKRGGVPGAVESRRTKTLMSEETSKEILFHRSPLAEKLRGEREVMNKRGERDGN